MYGSPASSLASSSIPARRFAARNMGLLVLVAIMAIAGCGDSSSTADRRDVQGGGKVTAQENEGAAWLSYRSLLEESQDGDQVLRVRVDRARNRLWVLALEHVDVYDIANKRLIRRIQLPGWSVAELICPPDMALDRSGTVFISHNVEPKLWEIAADNFQVKAHALRLVRREHMEIGFGALAFASDGSLYGVAATGGTLWHIDIDNAGAHQVELGAFLPDACALTVHAVGR